MEKCQCSTGQESKECSGKCKDKGSGKTENITLEVQSVKMGINSVIK
jgi:hypothetical protein